MKEYRFNGDWEFEINLKEFIKSNSKWEGNSDLKKLINLKILDLKNYEPDPSKEQLSTIDYIINCEVLVLKSICKAIDTINKAHGDSCGDHDWYYSEMSYSELGSVFLINEIEIFTEHKDGQSYFQLSGEYKGDYEHGLLIVMHNNRLIDYDQIGEDGYRGVYEDLGEKGIAFRNFNIERRDYGENQIHKPISKYGKFKPWQLNATSEYFDQLFREKKNQKLIDEIETNQWDVNLRFPSLKKNLVDKAAYMNNVEVLDYLIERGGDYSESILQCINYGFYRPEAIKFLVAKGASIDTRGYWGKTPLCNVIENFARIVVRKEEYKNKDKRRYERAMEEYEELKKEIRFYLELGADPNLLDKEENTYVEIVERSWAEHIIKEYRVLEQVEEVIFPERPKKVSWKFWRR